MKLVTNKPIAFFDLETTGTNPVKDKIVEIAILKINTDGSELWYEQRVNPGIPIPKETSAIHGIYDEDVKDMPEFKSIAKDVELFLRDCDLAGFNMKRFDLPLLMQSFVYDDKDKSNNESEDENNSEDDQSLNIFADNSKNNNQTFSSDNDDEYDIPAFLRKK